MSKFYLTTSIAYANAPPHLGFALELVQADAIARYRRQRGDEVFFLTGTDEHGAKITRAAKAANKDIKLFVDENAAQFIALKELLSLSWDDFIRTSDQQKHWPNAQELWNKLMAAGDIYKKNYRGLYCVGHEAFVTEKDLVNGICHDHGKAPEVIEEENYFFRLSKYALEVLNKIKSGELHVIPESRAHEISNFISEGIEDISFSRPRKDLAWGIPVPSDDSQTIYVWADALVNYLYKKDLWPAELHCIGKDILRFHTLYWPAMLLSAGLPLPKAIFVHGHITVGWRKMSKTLGNVIDPVALVKKYGVDAVRYYLLREIPPTDDGDFSYQNFERRYNGDLANGLGNFVARVLALAHDINVKKSDILSEPTGSESRRPNIDVNNRILDTRNIVGPKMSEYKFHEALAAIWGLISFGDVYINERKPWDKDQKTEDRSRTIGNALEILRVIAELLESFLPDSSQKIKVAIEQRVKINLFPRI